MWTLFLGLVFAQSPGLLDASESLKSSEQDEVHVQIDWQAHPAMHIPWKRFGKGLTKRPLTRRTWRHRFRQTVSARALADSDVRIFLAAAMAAERARNPTQARRLILKQLRYVEAFVRDHPQRYVLTKSLAECRGLGLLVSHKPIACSAAARHSARSLDTT